MDVNVRWMALAAVILIAAGCQSPDPSIELLESELRWMEDQLYTMDRELDQACLQISSVRKENSALRLELAQRGPTSSRDQSGSKSEPTPATGNQRPEVPPGVIIPSEDSFDDDDLQVPQIDLGPGGDSLESAPSFRRVDPDDFTSSGPVNVEVSRIVLNSRLTGGYDFDGHPGDEGLLLVVEPQNSAGQYVPLPGAMLVEVTDPSKQGPAARVARWHFDSADTVVKLRKTLLGRGIHLQLPWPSRLPDSAKLNVKVAFQSPTGKQLIAEKQIHVDVIASPPDGPMVTQNVMPDEFAPTPPPSAQLLTDTSMSPPSAPLSENRSRRSTGEPTEPQRRNVANRRDSVVPRWSPYR